MPKFFTTENMQFKTKNSPIPEYDWNTTEDLAAMTGIKDFACNVRSLEKGKFSYPYHFHHNAGELFVILSGKGELRTPEGIREIKAGEIALFENGASGAHQLHNPYDEPLVFLDLRAMNKIDVCEYPDTGKVNILPAKEIFDRGSDMAYFDKEENISETYAKLKSDE